MRPPPIASPSGEVFHSPPVTPTHQHVNLARALNRSIWMLPACLIFAFWDMGIMGMLIEIFEGSPKEDVSIYAAAAGVEVLFIWLRMSFGLRLARTLGTTTVWLSMIGLVLGGVGFFVFLSMISQAATILRNSGVKVGPFGVPPRERARLLALVGIGPYGSH